MDRFNHDLNVCGGGDDTDDTDDLPVFGSFGSYSPQYKKQNSTLNGMDQTCDDIFLSDEAIFTTLPSSSVDNQSVERPSGTGTIPKIKAPLLRKLDVSITQWIKSTPLLESSLLFPNRSTPDRFFGLILCGVKLLNI